MTNLAGSNELQILCWAVVLGVVQLFLASTMTSRDQGLAYNLTPRDAPAPPVTVVTGRLQRALRNFLETFVFFAAAVLALTAMGKSSSTSVLGAEIYLAARVIYLPVYAFGIPVLRTLVWAASMIGLAMVLIAALN